MAIKRPEEMFPQLARALNAGDIEGALALYEPDAGFVSSSGEVARGMEGIRHEFVTLVAMKATTSGEAVKTIIVKDLALVFVRYSASIPVAGEAVTEVSGLSTDVLRQQRDGTWLSVIDNPWGSTLVTGVPLSQELMDAAAAQQPPR